jgi:hypothetical protein
LELGNAPASSIARCASENRVTAYAILKDLCKRSLATETTRNKVKYYAVLEPKRLLNLQQEKTKKLEKSLSEFQAIASQGSGKNKVLSYEGLE